MVVMGKPILVKYIKRHANVKLALDAWVAETEESVWLTPQDIKNRFRTADFLADNRVIFNIKGNHYRLVVKVRYQKERLLIEWVGTHAEYSKLTF